MSNFHLEMKIIKISEEKKKLVKNKFHQILTFIFIMTIIWFINNHHNSLIYYFVLGYLFILMIKHIMSGTMIKQNIKLFDKVNKFY